MTPEPTTIRIDNIKEICDATEQITQMRISIVSIGASLEELTSQSEAQQVSIAKYQEKLDQIVNQIFKLINEHSEQIVDIKNVCRFPERWKEFDDRINVLEIDYYQRGGSNVWETRLWNIAQAVAIAMVVAVVLFFMKGGSIS